MSALVSGCACNVQCINLCEMAQVVKSACLQAHQQCRKADRLLAAGKYEEAISCHGKAAGKFCDMYSIT